MPVTVAGTHRSPTRAARARRALPALLAGAAALLLAAGCAPALRGAKPPQAPGAMRPGATTRPAATRPRPAAGYEFLRDSLPAAGALPLAGRRIAVDPGHGGYFKGCIGVGGLTEAEVNLGVALDLDTLLRAQGAAVLLTRGTDRDFLTPADSSLKGDLAERVRLANAFAPDLFVSVHHNADPGGAHDVNETQTYYKLGDEGPSYDAATDVHRSLVRNVGLEAQRLVPGNFAVVRGSDAPALLTESSYLTDPDVEARLRTPEARRLEAEALDIGIVRYFARRVPVVTDFWTGGATAPRLQDTPWEDGSVEVRADPHFYASIRGPFDDVTLTVDGERAITVVTDTLVEGYLERPLVAGRHTAAIRARLSGEGTSATRQLRLDVVSPPMKLVLDSPGGAGPLDGGLVPVRVRVLDGNGLPWPGPEAVQMRLVRPRLAAPAETTVTARDGFAWAYFLPRPIRREVALEVRGKLVRDAGTGPVRGTVSTLIGPHSSLYELTPMRMGVARVMPGGAPLRDAPGTTGPAPALQWLHRDGFAIVACDSLGAARAPRLPGFRAWGADSAWPPRYVEIAAGVLRGHRIVLDPEGGGDDAAGSGPSGTRAATLNLDVARALAGMLEAAGADVKLTRTGDAAVSEVERVQVAEGFRAERYLRIGHAAAPPVAGHYFSSGAGRRWAQAVARAFAELGLADSLHVGEVAKYALTQTSATALYVSSARVDSAASEARLIAPGACRAEGYALFLALAREFARDASPAAAWPVDSLEVRDAAGAPLPGVPVTLGGALVLQSGPDGRVRFAHTEPGPLEVRIDDPRAAGRERLLDSGRGREVPGPR